MTVRCQLSIVTALLALAFGASCRNRDTAQTTAEKDEPLYVEGMRLKGQGRHAEALGAFLKVIKTRGERPSPEAHLDAGVIYLHQLKDPLAAIYHFGEYLALLPNSKEAPYVRGKLDDAKREFARTLPGRPLEDQSARLDAADEIGRLRRENADLRAENEAMRGAVSSPVSRPRGMAIDVSRLLSPAPVDAGQPPVATPEPAVPIMQAPPRAAPVQTTAVPPQSATRTYTIKQSDGLWAIARQYDARNPGPKMRQIIEANPDILPDGVNTPLKPGMVLRIP